MLALWHDRNEDINNNILNVSYTKTETIEKDELIIMLPLKMMWLLTTTLMLIAKIKIMMKDSQRSKQTVVSAKVEAVFVVVVVAITRVIIVT